MRYLFFGFIILFEIMSASSAEAMRRVWSDDNASTVKKATSNTQKAPESYEMVSMSQSLPLGTFNFGGRERAQTPPNSPNTPQPLRRGATVSAAASIEINSPGSRRVPPSKNKLSFSSDEEDSDGFSSDEENAHNVSSEDEDIDGLPSNAEAWGMQNSQELILKNSGKFVVGSPERNKINPSGD